MKSPLSRQRCLAWASAAIGMAAGCGEADQVQLGSIYVVSAQLRADESFSWTVQNEAAGLYRGLSIEVPAEALVNDTYLTVSALDQSLSNPTGATWVGPALLFEPEDLDLRQNVDIRLPAPMLPEGARAIAVRRESEAAGQYWEPGGLVQLEEDGRVHVRANSFGRFQVGWREDTSTPWPCRALTDCPEGERCVDGSCCIVDAVCPP